MAKAPDISSKRLISLDPEGWARWALGRNDLSGGELLSGEFQFLSRSSDALMRLHAPDVGEFLALFELQLKYNSTMPRRLRAYAALAEEKYQCPVYPVLVNIRRSREDVIVNRYESTFMGLYARQDYRVINLWEIPHEELLSLNIPTLLPFVPMTQGGNEPVVVQHALEQLRDTVNLQTDDRLKDAALALLSFARYTLNENALQQIVRWANMIDLIRDSPLYQDIIRQGMLEGRQLGLQEGMQHGRQEELQRVLLRQLTRCVGPLSADTQEAVSELTLEQAETLAEDLLDFKDLADLQQWLHRKTVN